jgi:hypothetical protein
MNQPYLLLSLAALFWAGNIVLGRFIAADFPPMALSFLRWGLACLIVLPFAWPHLRAEWPVIRSTPVLGKSGLRKRSRPRLMEGAQFGSGPEADHLSIYQERRKAAKICRLTGGTQQQASSNS